MECPQIDLYEFLTESELQHYYNAIKNELKITNAAQFKYATDEDLRSIGLSRPEIRRLRKYYEKYFPHGYLSKIKRLLQAPTAMVKRDGDGTAATFSPTSSSQSTETLNATKIANSPSKVSNNKHIIPADSISVNKQLGTGEFGIVQQGVWTNGTERIQVAIKCLCRERMQSNPMEFLKEAAIMHSIEHENIVRLYGVVLATDSLMLVTELAHLRSLLECLKDSGLRVSFLTIPTLCEFAMQICNGMSYLEHKRLIHRDLAARNILVFSKNKVKISDFGLSRALGVGKDYYKTNFNVNLKLPIAWCAPECINYLRFTNASDVWAYGVCLWEMFSYGFQPWAALTGLQILEAIDAPNYQRLEQPDCCPREYYTLMMKCWQDDPVKRPKFSEIYEILPDMKPEQLKTVANSGEPKKDHLIYRQGEIIIVLDRNTGTPFWKGVLNSGKTGYFNPSNTVAFLEGLPSSNRDSFCRISERSSKRKLRTEMISKPQNDFKHTGHVGIDGASFGDVAFLSNSQSYNHVPRQIVTPYKPSEDSEQTPLLLPPTPTSPDSFQTASAYFPESSNATQSLNPTFVSSTENTPKKFSNTSQSSFEFPSHEATAMLPQINTSTNPFANKHDDDTDSATFAMANNNYGINAATSQKYNRSSADAFWRTSTMANAEEPHEYHEISDDEITADKLDFGPSLLDEINSMFGSMSASASKPRSPADFDNTNIKNEFAEMTSKLVRKNSNGNGGTGGGGGVDTNSNRFSSLTHKSKKTSGIVKPISVKDAKILNQAIEIANEISAKSMTDLVADPHPAATQSPKRKFSFRFPHLSSSSNSGGGGGGAGSGVGNNGIATGDKYAIGNGATGTGGAGGAGGLASTTGGGGNTISQFKSASPNARKKNFSEEIENIPDIQEIIGEDAREAYNSLIERKSALAVVPGLSLSPAATLLRHFDTNEFAELATAKTLPRRSIQLAYAQQQHQQQQQQHHHNHQNNQQSVQQQQQHAASIPFQHAPRPMTLPARGANSKMRRSVDLKRCCSSNNDSGKENTLPSSAGASPCESPSYLTHTSSYKFPPTDAATPAGNGSGSEDSAANPIPLPPRDGKKHIKTNPKRHVRKYPLIIPANGVQRTLNMMATSNNGSDGVGGGGGDSDATSPTTKTMANSGVGTINVVQVVATMRQPDVAQVRTGTGSSSSAPSHIYQNLEGNHGQEACLAMTPPPCDDDSASLQFESILEANKGQVLQSPDVTDGFYNFSIQKEHYNKAKDVGFDVQKITGLYVNEDELRNLDIDANTTTTTTTTNNNNINGSSTGGRILTAPRQKPPRAKKSNESELAGNALFKKVRESVDSAMCSSASTGSLHHNHHNHHHDLHSANAGGGQQQQHQTEAEYFVAAAARLASSNSVSCEDLLEFCDKKPKGCERGVDSDEVRIMMKVLGKASTPTRCLHVLEFIDWDVHKAIKVIKLQNILASAELDLSESVEVLQQHEWDLHATALTVKGLKA